MKKVAIALPAHNEEKSIYGTLESIKQSDFGGYTYQIYICLSACTDNTFQTIQTFKDKNKKIKITVLDDKKGGKVRALKILDKNIPDNIIVFMDSDCRPRKHTLFSVYKNLLTAEKNVPICSGNSIDRRYSENFIKSKSLIESFNRTFWQHPPRRIINGQLFAARKGVVQIIPDEVILDDPYLSIVHWDNFIKDNDALIDQGSPQNIWDVVKYQKSIESGKEQLKSLLGDLPNFQKITKQMYSQFDITLADRKKYYPNVSVAHVIILVCLISLGKLMGRFSKPIWKQTKSSKL